MGFARKWLLLHLASLPHRSGGRRRDWRGRPSPRPSPHLPRPAVRTVRVSAGVKDQPGLGPPHPSTPEGEPSLPPEPRQPPPSCFLGSVTSSTESSGLAPPTGLAVSHPGGAAQAGSGGLGHLLGVSNDLSPFQGLGVSSLTVLSRRVHGALCTGGETEAPSGEVVLQSGEGRV